MKISALRRVCGASVVLAICFVFAPRNCEATWGEQVDSIHFNSGQPDFGTLPRRGVLVGESELHAGHFAGGNQCSINIPDGNVDTLGELSHDRSDAIEASREARDRTMRKSAASCVSRMQWAGARSLYELNASLNGWSGDLRDRVEILSEVLRMPEGARPGRLIQRYFAALDQTYKTDGKRENAALPVFSHIAADQKSGFLRPHALYQMASLYSGWLDYSKAISLYKSLLQGYPRSSRREAALIMIARDGLLPETENAQAEAAGIKAVDSLLAMSPPSRFRNAALGLKARVDYANGNHRAAIQEYLNLDDMNSVEQIHAAMSKIESKPFRVAILAGWLRKLDRADTFARYELAVRFVRDSVADLDTDDAKKFVARLHRESDLAAPYLYYRLYLCDNKESDIDHLAILAMSLAKHYRRSGKLALSPLVQVRLAEVFYQQGRYATAIDWARDANAPFSTGSPYDRALYVIGASLHKQGQDKAAIKTFEALLKKCPGSALRIASHEELALLREVTGDESGALSEYFVLDYRPDIAFFLDTRMTTDQVARFVTTHPRHREHDLLVYSLGIRYLRDEQWGQARRVLKRLPRAVYVKLGTSEDEDGYRSWDRTDGPDPLKAASELSALKVAAERAPSGNLRASALYRCASYYYKSQLLLLYNGGLWKGRREFNFDFFWNESHATKADREFTSAYMHDHETYARCERICTSIVNAYPHSPTRPFALYRAACCEIKLAEFNGWWRSDKPDHRLAAAGLMARLAHEYPRHELAPEARKFVQVWRSQDQAAKGN